MDWWAKGKNQGMHMIRTEPTHTAVEDRAFEANYIPTFDNPEQFIAEKVKMLREQFKIEVTDEDIAYLSQYKTENEINAAVKGLFNKYWE